MVEKKMAEETVVIKLRMKTSTKKELQKIAESEYRSFAAQVQLAVDEWLKKRK